MTEIAIERTRHWQRTPTLERLALVLKRLVEAGKRRGRARINREALLSLRALDDLILADIGVERGDLDWAAQLPPEVDAAQALRRRAAWRERTAYHARAAARRRPLRQS